MRSYSSFVACLVVSLCVVLPASTSVAQPPDILSQYRFLPRHSTLHVQGGFAGFDILADIHGKFSFVEGFRFDFPHLHPYAAFHEVRAVALNPTDFGPYSFDIDETLNLTGLKGEALPVAAPFDVYKFHGEEGQGARMELTVIQLGRWLYMNGSNDAPCCDFFDYQIEAIARRTPFADFTEDDRVDERDLTKWLEGYGRGSHGDADGDDDSDGGDFLTWQRQLGEEMPPMDTFASIAALSSQLAALSAVPEPNSVALGACVTMLAITARRRRS